MVWLKRIALVFIIICLGTAIDFAVHSLSVVLAESPEYFTHKIIYGTIWAFVGYLLFRKYAKNPVRLAFAMAAVPAVLLQTFYFVFEHDPIWKTAMFLFVHFFAFWLCGYFICKKFWTIFQD